MRQRCVDVAIIGAGTAGLTAHYRATDFTDNVVLIESGPYRTTCARVGCMPSKLLIAAAEAAHRVAMAPRFGVRTGSIEIDGQAVMQRVRSERDRFVAAIIDSVEAIDPADKLRGYAHFADNQRTPCQRVCRPNRRTTKPLDVYPGKS